MTETTDKRSTRPGLPDVIYERILSDIVDGAFSENSRLASENALATKFKVSRPVIREALSRLRDDGLVVSRQGSGSFVVAKPSRAVRAFAPLSSIMDMQRCFEFRVSLEGEAAYHAALRRTDVDMIKLLKAYEVLEEVVATSKLGVVEDYDFHMAIASATHNRFYVEMMELLKESVTTGITLTRNLSLRRSNARIKAVQAEHTAIVRTIESGDASGARNAMRLHIDNARLRVFDGVDEDVSSDDME